jgi:hypothetical protein
MESPHILNSKDIESTVPGIEDTSAGSGTYYLPSLLIMTVRNFLAVIIFLRSFNCGKVL